MRRSAQDTTPQGTGKGGGLDTGCILCGGREFTVEAHIPDRIGRDAERTWEIRQCDGCGLMWTHPQADDLDPYYPADYEPHHSTRRRGPLAPLVAGLVRAGFVTWRAGAPAPLRFLGLVLRKGYNALALRSLPEVPALRPNRERGRGLDVGCGVGEHASKLMAIGWDMTGVEPAARAVARAREIPGLRVVEGTLGTVVAEGERYDLVVMSHVLEHVRDPRHTLEQAFDLLSPGGSIQVMVPNTAAVGRHVLGPDWHPYEAPRHLWHFSPQTLTKLLEGAGFEGIQCHPTVRVTPLLKSIRGRLDLDGPLWSAARLLLLPMVWSAALGAAPSLRTSQFWAVARRPESGE